MEHRRLGLTDLRPSVIGMGTWQTYDVRDPGEVQPVTDAVLAEGVTFFDSSPMYGAAERVLAETLGERRSSVVVATKVWARSGAEGREQVERVLRWYGGCIDLYQIHNLEGWETHLPYLEALKEEGRIRAVGITHWSPSAFDRIARLVETDRVAAIQVPYNPREREVEHRLLPLAAERGVGVVLMRPFGEGALVRTAPPARELGFLADYGLRTWAQALLNWGVSDPRVTVTIPASRDVRHAVDNASVGCARRFTPSDRERVATLADRL